MNLSFSRKYLVCVFLTFSSPIAAAGQWEIVAGPGPSGGLSDSGAEVQGPDIEVRNNGELFAVWAVWTEGIFVKHFDGEQWAEYGAGSASGNGIVFASVDAFSRPQIALDSQQEPMVAFGNGRETHINQRHFAECNEFEWIYLESFSDLQSDAADIAYLR